MSTLTVLCLTTVLVGGTLGNILIILAVYINTNLHTVPNYLLVNLAVAEALRALIAVPLRLVNIARGTPAIPCIVIILHDIFFHGLPNWSLVLIALDRFVAVKKSLSYLTVMTVSLLRYMIGTVWSLMLALVLLPVLGWGLREPGRSMEPGGSKQPNASKQSSSICRLDETLDRSYIIFECIMIDVLPFFIIVGLYSQVLAAVRGQISRQRAREGSMKREHQVQQKTTRKRNTNWITGYVNYAVSSVENVSTSNEKSTELTGIQLISFRRTNTECVCSASRQHAKTEDIHKYIIQTQYPVEQSTKSDKAKGKGNLRATKATRTVSCIIFFFVLLCFPMTILDLLKLFCVAVNPPKQVVENFACLVYLNACVNVFIYGWCNRRFRKTFFIIFQKVRRRLASLFSCRS